MIDPQFSRRAAKLKFAPIIMALDLRERFAFFDRCEQAEKYENLAAEDKQLFLRAELETMREVSEFNPWHDSSGRFATGGGMAAPDTGGGGASKKGVAVKGAMKISISDNAQRKNLQEALRDIPKEHLVGIKEITDVPPAALYDIDDQGMYSPVYGRGTVSGVYTWLNQTIHVAPGVLSNPDLLARTLTHEVGHHVFTTYDSSHKNKFERGVEPMRTELKSWYNYGGGGTRQQFEALGFRFYSITGAKEVLADSYLIWSKGTKTQWDGVRKMMMKKDPGMDPEIVLGSKRNV